MNPSEAFLAGHAKSPSDPRFHEQLAQCLAEVTAQFPLSPIRLALELGKRAPPVEAASALATLHVTDIALTLAAADFNPAALSAFDALLTQQARVALKKLDPSDSFADEVAQLLRQRLLLGDPQRLLDYSGRGSLAKWLRIAALRTGLDLRRGVNAQTESDDALADMPAPDDGPEFDVIRSRYGPQFREAFTEALQSLSSQARNLLRLHYLEGASMAQLGQHYNLHRTTVARHLDEARQVLFDETRRRVAERLPLGRDEFESLMRVLRSQLDISIRRLLKATQP